MRPFLPAAQRLAMLLLLLLAGGCALFAPRYDAEVGNRASEAYEHVAQLLAEAEYGKFRSPETFAAAIDRYAEADALLATAAMRAAALPVSAGPAVKARELLVRQIEGCRARVKSLAAIHQRSGIAPDAGLTENAFVSCDQAARAATAMK